MKVIDKMLEAVTPDIYERFKRAVETGKWPNGERLTEEQRATCMQAIIAFDARFNPPEQRVGYVPSKVEPCADNHESTIESPIKWQ